MILHGFRPKIKLFLFPLTRPTVKKAADRKNYISKFEREYFFAVPVFIIFLYRLFVSAAYKRLEIDNCRLIISESSVLFSLIQYGRSCRLRIGSIKNHNKNLENLISKRIGRFNHKLTLEDIVCI